MLSYGMPYDLFWNGPPAAMWDYVNKAQKENDDAFSRMNQQCHLQGRYFYEALYCMAPVLVAFPKKDAKPVAYPDEPLKAMKPLTEEQEQQKREYLEYLSMKNLERYSKQKNHYKEVAADVE